MLDSKVVKDRASEDLMDKTRLYAYIKFIGNDDFPLDVLTERLGVKPTSTWKVGSRVNYPEFSAFAAAINAFIDIDMYVNPFNGYEGE